MSSQKTSLQSLFTVKAYRDCVTLCMSGATNLQAYALADWLHRTRTLGTFRQIQNVDGSDCQLRFATATLEQVQQLMTAVSTEDLFEDIAAIEQTAARRATAQAQAKRITAMSPAEFGQLLHERSAGKIRLAAAPFHGDLALTTVELMPVTHFKALARLTTYNGKLRRFTVSSGQLGLTKRERLLELADKLARSTKKVTHADVAARRAMRKPRQSVPSGAELENLIEDYVHDFYGYDSAENFKAAREAVLNSYKIPSARNQGISTGRD